MNFLQVLVQLITFLVIFPFTKQITKTKRIRPLTFAKLDNIILNSLFNSNLIIVVSNVSIKNNITTSITHIYSYSNSIKKTLYHAVSITFTKTKLFAIRYSINQAIQIQEISHIIIITDSIYVAYQIFNLFIYSFQ